MKFYLIFLMAFCFWIELPARLVNALDYETQNNRASLIVITSPTTTAETSELAALPNITTVYQDGRQEAAIGKGVETTFKILTVLKGDRNLKSFVLHHFMLAGPPGDRGPNLVAFKPKDEKQFLMFLQKEPDGRYIAVCGQTDPVCSIKEIAKFY